MGNKKEIRSNPTDEREALIKELCEKLPQKTKVKVIHTFHYYCPGHGPRTVTESYEGLISGVDAFTYRVSVDGTWIDLVNSKIEYL